VIVHTLQKENAHPVTGTFDTGACNMYRSNLANQGVLEGVRQA